jgi:Ca2+-binding EF-hand superfamily protein
LTVFVLLPLVFTSGALASIAKVWRRDVSIAAIWMSNVTTNAFDLIQTKFDEKKRRWREEDVHDFFTAIRRRQQSASRQQLSWFAPRRIGLDDLLSCRLHECVGIGSKKFITALTTALQEEERAHHPRSRGRASIRTIDDLKLPWSLSFFQFRRFVSLVVQRLAVARDFMRLRLVFKELLAEGTSVITSDDLNRLPHVMGTSILDKHELKFLAHRCNRNNGTLDMTGFLRAMYFVMTEQKVRQLRDEKSEKDKRVRAVFAEHALDDDDDDDDDDDAHGDRWNGHGAYLDKRAFKAASIQLGLAWNLRIIRDIQHADKQRRAGGPVPQYHWLLYATLETLESGTWHWLAVLPLIAIALHVGGSSRQLNASGASLFSDIFVPTILTMEVLLRLVCFRMLGKSLRQFVVYNSHNAVDIAASLLDVALVLTILTGKLDDGRMIAIARYVRLARLLPLAKRFFESGRKQSLLRFFVTLDDFRRFASVCKMDEAHERPVWPLPSYRIAFMEFDQIFGTHAGAVPLSELKELVNAAGFWPSPYILSRIKEVLTTDDDTNLIYFDDFIEAISLVRDERVESMMLACMEHPRKRAQR